MESIAQVTSALELINLEDKLSLKLLAEKINEIIEYTKSQKAPVVRNRGPQSEKVMSEDDARRVMLGDLKGHSHKDAAEMLGLSYGQIYSARKGFTFKPVYKEMMEAAKTE